MCESHRKVDRVGAGGAGKGARGPRRGRALESRTAAQAPESTELQAPSEVELKRVDYRRQLNVIVEEFDVVTDSPRVDLLTWKRNARGDYARIVGLQPEASIDEIAAKMRELGFSQKDADYLLQPIQG